MGYTLRMKRLILIFFICIFPAAADSHPGKTNRYGGHKCLKGCVEWGLFYDEYHLHDKDWRPIRISKNKKAARPVVFSEPVKKSTDTVPIEKVVDRETVTIYKYVTTIREENVLYSNPLLYILLILLLLLLILKINRKSVHAAGEKT